VLSGKQFVRQKLMMAFATSVRRKKSVTNWTNRKSKSAKRNC